MVRNQWRRLAPTGTVPGSAMTPLEDMEMGDEVGAALELFRGSAAL